MHPSIYLQVELQREEFERWFAVMRAHLTAGHRPMMYWSPAIGNAGVAGATGGSPFTTVKAAHAGGAGAAAGDAVGAGDDSANAGTGSNDSPLSAMTSGDVDSSFDGNNDGSGDCREGSAEKAEVVSESKRSQRDGGGHAGGGHEGEGGDHRDVVVSTAARGGPGVSVGDGGVGNAGDVVASHEKKPTACGDGVEGCGSWKRGIGEHHEGLQWVRCLERLAMKRAHLNGAFDMEKASDFYSLDLDCGIWMHGHGECVRKAFISVRMYICLLLSDIRALSVPIRGDDDPLPCPYASRRL